MELHQINPTLIMKKGLQCFEEAPEDFHNLLIVDWSNVAIDEL